MGLDNGIVFRANKNIPQFEKAAYFGQGEFENVYEVCYWRKCWNVRAEILDIVNASYSEDLFEYPVSFEDIDKIIKILRSYNSKTWDENGSSIWYWEEAKRNINRCIYRLTWLKKIIKELKALNEPYELLFYDSY